MRTLRDIPALRETLGAYRRRGQHIALVPTMGNLHAGHLALVEAARRRGDVVVATIFVNPLQFGPSEDLDAYPRTLADDQTKLEEAGCDLLFTPDTAMLYPRGLDDQTRVCVPAVSEGLCGGARPGHAAVPSLGQVTAPFHLTTLSRRRSLCPRVGGRRIEPVVFARSPPERSESCGSKSRYVTFTRYRAGPSW